jgi:hypothetical protein
MSYYTIYMCKKQIIFHGDSRSISLHYSACNMFSLLEFLRKFVLKCPIKMSRYFIFGPDKTQGAGHQLLTTGARLRSQANLCGICEGKLPLRQNFLRVLRLPAVCIFPPFGPHISVIWHLVTSSKQVTASLNKTTVFLTR